MEYLDVNQVIRIMGWTYPTAKKWVVLNGGKMVDNGAGVGKWVIPHEVVIKEIKASIEVMQLKEKRYWSELRKTESTS